MKLLQAALLSCVLSTGLATRIVCYFTNWSLYGSEPFKVEDIDATQCTHIVYSFLGLESSGHLKLTDPWNDVGDQWHEGALKKFPRLKNANPSLKILLGVGGWGEGPLAFQGMVRDPQKRKAFLDSSLSFINTYKFDGLEIDWFYHNAEGGTPADKEGFSQLVKEMRASYSAKNYLITIATSASPLIFDNSYDITTLSKYVDFINILSYDLNGSWNSRTGHPAPLYPSAPGEENNLEAIINRYISKGAVASQLNLGVIGYGRTFTLADPKNHGINAPSTGPGKIEPLPYRVFCDQDRSGLWTKYKDDKGKVPYAVSGNQWVGYEDVQSLVDKVKFGKSKRLGGVTFWSFDMDDFKGKCGAGKFPLLKAVKAEITKP